VRKEDRAWIAEEDLIAEAVLLAEEPMTVGEVNGTAAVLNGAMFSEDNPSANNQVYRSRTQKPGRFCSIGEK
jgi:hypothetical protein